ncbi:MAG: CDP-glycerol glycerophosphotransferase family protein [bacterium]|nr:CDP-glycerol glycerophosphotransferase family protein [bacterium]
MFHILFFPKKKNLWVFGAWFGEKFSDNSKYLFQYIATNHPEIQAVWLTKNKQTFNFLRKQGFECYYLPSAKGLLLP